MGTQQNDQEMNTSFLVLILIFFMLPLSTDLLPSSFLLAKYLLTFLLSYALASWATPLAHSTALQYNIVDKPDGRLKDHVTPTPYLGGIVVYISFLLTLSFTFGFNEEILGITLAGSVLVIVGLFDDMQAVTPQVKFLGQMVAILVLIKAGIRIELIALPELLNVPLTALWIAGVINAINIIDIMDGLATGVAFCAALILFLVAVMNQNTTIAVLTLALAGSLLGLLKFNFEPAQIYLGDTGSMFIGLMLGSLSMVGSYTQGNSLGFVAPVLILGVPIFDMLFVMILRRQKGISMFLGSKDHFALRCLQVGYSVKQVCIMSYAATLTLGGVALLIMQSGPGRTLWILLVLMTVLLFIFHKLHKIKMPSNREIFGKVGTMK
ncbi:MAG: undecaprenyl/decaprenyl-phosphate alpha-N-acetylglucosaminyl 1-phosphate transferase [bacterium]|nr:undecaprenyl/decaprenyl-phosphate alpha-N-acetylglucosaminyl 1-phosphate transferase [bacterium]